MSSQNTTTDSRTLATAMTQATAFRFSRKWQSRISAALSLVLCLWLLSAATHSHTGDQDKHHTRAVAHACGFCNSLSSGGAAASVVGFGLAIVPDATPSVPRAIQPPTFRLIVSHRSRAPPVA